MNNLNQKSSDRSNNGFSNYSKNDHFSLRETNNPSANELSMGWIFAQLLYYKWALLLFIATGIIVSLVIAWSIQPVYQTSGTLLINDAKNRYSYAGSDLSNLLTSSYGLGVGSTFANQLEIIRSRKIAKEIAKRVQRNPQMSNGNISPILFTEYPNDSTIVNEDQLIGRIRSKMRVLRKENNADIAIVYFESYSPLEAATLVNLVMDTYTEVSTEQNRQSARAAREFLETQRVKTRGELGDAEQDLKTFQERTGFVEPQSQTTSQFAKLTQLEQKKQEQRINLLSIDTAIENYENELEKIRPDFSENFAENVAPVLSQLQDKLAELEAERIVLLNKNPALEENPSSEPQLVDLNTQISRLKANIRSRANTILNSDSTGTGFLTGEESTRRLSELQQQLIEARIQKAQSEAQISAVNQMQEDQEAQMEDVPREILELARLQRDLAMKESLFQTIAQQYAETSLWEQTQSGAGSPLDYATVPGRPVAPDMFVYIIVGLFLGSVVGIGYVFFRIETNTKIDSPDRMAELSYPLLSVIPDFTQDRSYQEKDKVKGKPNEINKNWITLYNGISSSAEAFRKLQNNILYSRPDQSLKTLMVTSSTQGEGKTSVSVNLATTLTEAGKKVIIVDSDLRRPKLHKLVNLSKSPGLMDVIFEGKSLDESIQSTRHEDVFILSVGNRPPNPAAVLRSEKMAKVMHDLRKKYDYIILDTPPLGIVGDAAPLVRYMDGVIVVSMFKETEMGQLKKLVHELEHLHSPILGTVLTKYDPEKSAYTYYHSSKYYYSYQSYENYVEQK